MSSPVLSTVSSGVVNPTRWRFAVADDVRLTGTDAETSTTYDAETGIRELSYLGPAGPGRVKVLVQRLNPTTPAFAMWTTKTEFDRVTALGVPVAELLTKHVASGYYAPVAGQAFVGEPHFRQVQQGDIGSCRCASAFQSLAAAPNGPKYLKHILRAAEHGWTVSMWRGTKPVAVTVDDHLPIGYATKALLYQLPLRKQTDTNTDFALWPALLEKALAGLFGGYARVEHNERAITEEEILGALGIGKPNRCSLVASGRDILTDVTGDEDLRKAEAKLKAFVEKCWGQGCAITVCLNGRSHNVSIVNVTETGILLADPYTVWSDEVEKRLAKPVSASQGHGSYTKSSLWPLFFTWENAAKVARWLWAFDVPLIEDKDSKLKEKTEK